MKRFELVRGVDAHYIVTSGGKGLVVVHLKKRADRVCRAFNSSREHWSAKSKKDMVIVSLNLYYGASKIYVVNAIERGDACREGLAHVIDGIQREAYSRLAEIRLGCAG